MKTNAQKILHKLLTQLDADTYAKMCNSREDRGELETIKNSLSKEIIVEPSASAPSHALAMSFAKASKLQEQYERTVGTPDEILSTIELATLPEFTVGKNDEIGQKLDAQVELWGLSEYDVKVINDSVKEAVDLLDQRRKTVDWLRSLVTENDGGLKREKVYQLFTALFPGHPLQEDQVDLIATRTGVYWLIPKQLEDKVQQAWIDYYDRFSFNRFVHFPMFSGFEVRDSNSDFISSAMESLEMNFHDVIEVLNSVISMQKRDDVEKYIIHDTWGHIWQADLTDFRHFYDKMESLRRPMEASMSVTYPCGNVVCLADLYFPEQDQSIRIEDEEAETFIKAWVDVHTTATLAPLIAEMTADIIEYKFVLDHPLLEAKMPSSSVFKNDPAKFDFAWVDFSYFARELRKIHRSHFRDTSFQESFNQRLIILLKDRYKHRLSGWTDDRLQNQVGKATGVLFSKFEQIQDEELSNKVECLEPSNYFFRKLQPLLSMQATVNDYIDTYLSKRSDKQTGHFELLVLFIGIAFCDWLRNPEGKKFPEWSQQFSQQLSNMMKSAE